MFKTLSLLTVLVLALGITSNVAMAGPVSESFADSGTIDIAGPANETPVMQAASGLIWGGYNNYVTTDTAEIKVSITGIGTLISSQFRLYVRIKR